MNRRQFLLGSAAAGGAAMGRVAAGWAAQGKPPANERITVAVVGVRGRGRVLLAAFASLPQATVKYVVDVDESVRRAQVEAVARQTGRRPEPLSDFRRALDDKNVDALVLGTPDHWHGIPTILACQAGKDVYVEKPDAHNALEGRVMVAAARRHRRIVQLGTQSRSSPHFLSAVAYVSKGGLGRVHLAKAWESSRQGSIGHPPDGDPPKGVDYDFWLGPAPKRRFNVRRFHGTWRWFFDYGTGDLGNDGVHRLDVARWVLGAAVAAKGGKLPDLPRAVFASGGKYYFDDDQEWPDTLMVTYEYPGCVLTYEMRVWSPNPIDGEDEGAAVFGDQGCIVLGNSQWRAYDAKGKVVAEDRGGYDNSAHAVNFLECMQSRKAPNADLETVGHPSSLLCHLGNASWRSGQVVRFDPATYDFGGPEANRYQTRPEYRKPWVLPQI